MGDPIALLEGPVEQHERCGVEDAPKALVASRGDDRVSGAGLVLQSEEAKAFCGSRTLPDDDQARPLAYHLARFAQNEFDEPCVLAGLFGKREGPGGRSNDRQRSAASLRLGDDLLREYEHVALLKSFVRAVESREHKLREVFKKARDKASEDVPVVIFFDEMDSLFRMRGSGISSDMEATVVAQFLSEIDGVESLNNVIVIGASNRQDLIDPAVLRPGRLDLKIKVHRPDEATVALWRREAEAAWPRLRGKMVPADLFDEAKRLRDEARAATPSRP